MFFILNKQKIFTYLITVSTVVTLLFIAIFSSSSGSLIETSAVTKELSINTVKTRQNRIALILDCVWSADDINFILKILENNGIKATFFVVDNWGEKNLDVLKRIYEAGHEVINVDGEIQIKK